MKRTGGEHAIIGQLMEVKQDAHSYGLLPSLFNAER